MRLGADLLGPVIPRAFMSEAHALPARTLVHAVSVATRKVLASERPVTQPINIELTDNAPPALADCVREFVPTMISLRPLDSGEALSFRSDTDHGARSRFLSAVYLVEREIPRGSGRVVLQAARAYLAPPAIAAEAEQRAELVSASGKGVPLPFNEEDGGRLRLLSSMLTESERRDVRALPIDEQLALVTVLAGREGAAAVASRHGTVPGTPLVLEIAERLGRRVVRCCIQNVPLDVLMRIQQVRYLR
jgi:hypothetical protein